MRGTLAVLSLTAISAAQNVYSGKADGLSAHTIYMPTNAPGKIPVLIWGSGGCIREGGDQHGPALKETASHGIMIIAMGNSRSAGSGSAKGRGGIAGRQAGGAMGGMGGDIKAHEEAIAWALKNAGQGKYANVDASRMAVAGQSCGGIEAYNVISKHPAIKTIGIFNSGTFAKNAIVSGMKQPIFYFLGGSSDIAYKQGERDFTELPKTTPTWKGNLPVGHMATYTQPKGGKFGTAMWKWLDWTLAGNAQSATFFTGDGAGSAKADGWTVEKRNLDTINITPIS